MRLFVAVDVPKEIKDDLYRIQNYVPGSLAKVKWVAKKNLHITLKFLGEVKERELPELIARLEKVTFKKFKLSLKDMGFYNYSGEPKVIRLNFEDTSWVYDLQRKIDEELLDMFSSDQKFSAHLTLGRIKSLKKKDDFFKKVSSFRFSKFDFIVNQFCLIESVLTKDGPKYKVIKNFKHKFY